MDSERELAPLIFAAIALVSGSGPLWAVEHIQLRRDGAERHISGRLLIKAADGGLLVLASDGELWAVQPDELVSQSSDETPFAPLARALGPAAAQAIARGL